ncbi:MAG: coenzyme F420-0:L-glutamate ligase [Bacilli bacterium]|nr:coenzyme F420-0:L-glutamate ligase [Bacilli bacterium]MDD4795604.1 coenzyme F420-0:L-glutamate ligase [Bacilli bacterium]
MARYLGTVAKGIRTPIIKENDDLQKIVIDSLINASKNHGFEFKDKDIVAITEAVVGKCEGNIVSLDEICLDLKEKFPSKKVGLVYPILSRNRFSLILKGIARYMDEITILISFPSDEVGNGILDEKVLKESKYNLNSLFTDDEYYDNFGEYLHPFTGVNMIDVYKNIVLEENCKIKFIFSNNPIDILKYQNDVINCDIHTRYETKELLVNRGANVFGLFELLNKPLNNSGYNSKYGLLGSNKSTEEKLKLFPEHGEKLVYDIQKELKEITGKNIEVMIYGDGAFKDPVGGIWELADPVVSPAYTKGLDGTPNEIKLKYISDNKFSNLIGSDLDEALKLEIKNKKENLVGNNLSLGTTPRRTPDLVGSLADLVSGSGDKGTPVVYISGYFDNLADD